jgi:hypothetical protein
MARVCWFIITWSAALAVVQAKQPTAFDLTFTSNNLTYEDYIVTLQHPLPDWINGIYVSCIPVTIHGILT